MYYENVKNIIMSGFFKLSDMKNKIEILWLQGDLTDEQRTGHWIYDKNHGDFASDCRTCGNK